MMIIFGDDSFKYVKSTSVLIASVEYIQQNVLMFPLSKLTLVYWSICNLFLVFLSRNCSVCLYAVNF